MKKAISLILIFVLCLGLCACGGGKKSSKNPILGTWESKTNQMEASFAFEQEGKELTGTWTYYDYSDNTWGEFDFRVKEQTDYTITLLIEDGTLDAMTCWISGDNLYMDGNAYTNSKKDVKLPKAIREKNIVVNDVPIPVYKNVLLGMSVSEVEIALGQQLPELEKAKYYSATSTYRGTRYPYKVELKIDKVTLDLYFDEDMLLVALEQTLFSNEIQYKNEFINNADREFGAHSQSERTNGDYHYDIYTWNYGNVTISLEYTKNTVTGNAWASSIFEYRP